MMITKDQHAQLFIETCADINELDLNTLQVRIEAVYDKGIDRINFTICDTTDDSKCFGFHTSSLWSEEECQRVMSKATYAAMSDNFGVAKELWEGVQ